MSAHNCHAHGCKHPVPVSMFMCRPHWKALRQALRDAMWREYRPGQEHDKQPSARYLAVQQRAIAELCFKPDDGAAAAIAAPYLLASEVWRATAIVLDQGDPLALVVPEMPGIREQFKRSAS